MLCNNCKRIDLDEESNSVYCNNCKKKAKENKKKKNDKNKGLAWNPY